MQVTLPASITNPRNASVVTRKEAAAPVSVVQPTVGPTKGLDLSHITPRSLHAYIDERVMSGEIDDTEMLYCSSLFCSIPDEWYSECPDMPVDVTSRVKSFADFTRAHGLTSDTTFYEGMLAWMKMSEEKSVHISVVA
ncbi:hypothetical protein BJI69_03165 [Luteibacter rhizovicinus DSM 16549]|uniref:Uncharacterized protein n=1 Tax=Luteibacter rhizovicinus DSM 16549 TaxID=1440763 RepID=A0A0G9HBC4_9GAMM|nr:hypothetical protein [Luteibacter rhizovicinus]APG03003.1 hypothetical protein BJI69_03165 [Luteibacter rhizovicinus DSM 16549]KLD64987.1 hypothetical protein Y883_17115 [Luteibacter rhizovicinus DSM 16549]KLD77430.1 hypothetical protein Y886_15735 [Xanthomonas hyacinthi DSM 19077]